MKKNIFYSFALVSIFLLCGLNCAKSIRDDSVYRQYSVETVSFWLDPETSTVHKMLTVNEKSEIVSIIRYSDGVSTEVMEIIKSEIVDGKVKWAYYVPSTGYTVEMKTVSFNNNEIVVEWNNRDMDGKTDSGRLSGSLHTYQWIYRRREISDCHGDFFKRRS